ncbi:MAG: phage tail tube protein [Phycisphaerales bacterium JB063]
MTEFLLGMNAKLYQGTAGAALDTLTEMSNVRDATLNLEAGEADVTTRGNSGWRATATTLRECTCEFDMLWKPGDAGFEAIKDAYLTSSPLRLAALTGAKSPDGIASVAGSEGVLADFSITNFSRSEPLEEGITVSVTAKLSVFDQWIEDGLEAA